MARQGCKFRFLGRALRAALECVCSGDEERVCAVGNGCWNLDSWPTLAKNIQILLRGPDLRFRVHASASNRYVGRRR